MTGVDFYRQVKSLPEAERLDFLISEGFSQEQATDYLTFVTECEVKFKARSEARRGENGIH